MHHGQMDLVAVGHIVCETIRFPDRTVGPVLGSPPAYSLVAAARQGIRTGIVTKIGKDFPSELLEVFLHTGVDTSGIRFCPRSSSSELIYDESGGKEIRFPSRADPVGPEDFPSTYKGCRLIYVCTMEDDVPLVWLPAVVELGLESAIDLGGYGGVHMSGKRRGEIGDIAAFALEAAGRFDFVKASDEDCRRIFGTCSVEEYVRIILTGRCRTVLITRGSEGVTVGTRQGVRHVPALSGKPIDVTGGGDAFMGGFLSEYLRCGEVIKSVVVGSATAMCVIERTGGVTPERMPTEKEVLSRISGAF